MLWDSDMSSKMCELLCSLSVLNSFYSTAVLILTRFGNRNVGSVGHSIHEQRLEYMVCIR